MTPSTSSARDIYSRSWGFLIIYKQLVTTFFFFHALSMEELESFFTLKNLFILKLLCVFPFSLSLCAPKPHQSSHPTKLIGLKRVWKGRKIQISWLEIQLGWFVVLFPPFNVWIRMRRICTWPNCYFIIFIAQACSIQHPNGALGHRGSWGSCHISISISSSRPINQWQIFHQFNTLQHSTLQKSHKQQRERILISLTHQNSKKDQSQDLLRPNSKSKFVLSWVFASVGTMIFFFFLPFLQRWKMK